MQHIDIEAEAKKFQNLVKDLDSLIEFAKKARDYADDQADHLNGILLTKSEMESCDPSKPEEAEHLADLKKTLEHSYKGLVDPIKRGKPSPYAYRRSPSLETLLEECTIYGDFKNFKSPLIDLARQQEEEEQKKI